MASSSAISVSREIEAQMKAPLYVSPSSSSSAQVLQSGTSIAHGALALHGGRKRGREVVEMEYMFSKTLTQSDVGKLNRFLIPRQCAERFFPYISEAKSEDSVFLNFEDSSGLFRRFQFCRWSNGKTFALTKGWPMFVKEKNIKKDDIVSFYRNAAEPEYTNHFFIHIIPHVGITSFPHPPTNLIPQPTPFPESTSLGNSIGRAEKHLRLFGVNISIPPRDSGDESANGFTSDVS